MEIRAADKRAAIGPLSCACIAAQRVDRLAPADIHHLEDRCSTLGRRREEACAGGCQCRNSSLIDAAERAYNERSRLDASGKQPYL